MKKYYFLLVLITASVNAQIVNIPDANFKAKLLAADVTNSIASTAFNATIPNTFNKIDVNNDGEIQLSEAANVTLLNISNSGISNLTGIEAFSSLRVLKCQNNLITSLNPIGFTLLVWLECQNNLITQLDVSNLIYLQTLFCYDNQITSLGLNNLPSLSNFYCGNNQLTSLDLSEIPILFFLGCENNQITTLDASGLGSIQVIDCQLNQLTALDVTNATDLVELSCGQNLFTTLNLNTNTSLKALYIYGCQNLESLFMHNGSDESTNVDSGSWMENWVNCPNLSYICVDENEAAPLRNLINSIELDQNQQIEINTYCSFIPGGDYNTITGKQLFDLNNAGCQVDNTPQPFLKINIDDGVNSGSTFTNSDGQYKFYVQNGAFVLTPEIENPSYFVVNPVSTTISLPTVNNSITTQNFCIAPNGTHQDLEIVIAPITPARPGFQAVYKVVYRNKGNTLMSLDYGVTFLYNHNLMSFVSADVTPDTIGPGGLSWNYSNLKPFESRSILVTMQINSPTDLVNPVNIGDELVFNSTISPIGPDEAQVDNYGILHQIVVGSYDPNDIQCLEGAVVNPTEIGKYLHYVIRFENTGTAAAENIVVKTEINPADFDISSLQLLNASHATDARVKGNVVEFIFKNIMLDSGGHGNILLKIKSKSNLTVGDAVNKKADIFFDYNFPVLTNEAETVFQTLSVGATEPQFAVKIYPNPTENVLYLKAENTIKSIQLFDVQGRVIMTRILDEKESRVDISRFPGAIYFLKITTDKGTSIQKVIKK